MQWLLVASRFLRCNSDCEPSGLGVVRFHSKRFLLTAFSAPIVAHAARAVPKMERIRGLHTRQRKPYLSAESEVARRRLMLPS